MTDRECVEFLQWALPRMGFRWAGFRRVRRQVCKRLKRRLAECGILGLPAYASHLESHTDEWPVLDAMCRITITRFFRDRRVWSTVGSEVLPRLAAVAVARGDGVPRCWSVGCGSGEEPYTLAIISALGLSKDEGVSIPLHVVATEADPRLLERARRGVYAKTSLRSVPPEWVGAVFDSTSGGYSIRDRFRERVEFLEHDVRREMPDGPFHLVLCRNLVFTYFDETLQRKLAEQMGRRIRGEGFLLVGSHESLPSGVGGFRRFGDCPGLYRCSM